MRARFTAYLLAATAIGCGSSGAGPAGEGPGDDASQSPVDSSLPSSEGGSDGGVDATLPDAGDASTGPCGVDMALVTVDASFACIDLYEGALVQLQDDGGWSAWPWYMPVDDVDASVIRAVPAHGIYPQGYISNVQATAACAASGKRLCTFDEWTAACRGQPEHDYVYPYGDTYEPGYCNEGKESPIVELFGPDPSYDDQELNDPRCDQLEGGLAQGGDYPKCESTYGAFDMHGNIHEWIDQTNEGGTGSFMGGYFVDATLNGPGCEYRTTAHDKTYHDYSTGFRCCADPN